MKLNMKRLIALGLALVMVMSSLTPSYASAAKKSDDVLQVEASVVEESTVEVEKVSEVESAIEEAAYSSAVVTTVEVAESAMTQEEASKVVEETFEDEAVAAFNDVTYTTDEEGMVTEITVVTDESVAKAAAEIEAVAEGDTTSQYTTDQVLEMYYQLQYIYESCPMFFGVPVPYFVEKGPINSLMSVIAYDIIANGMDWTIAEGNPDFDQDGVPDLTLDLIAQVVDGYTQVLYICGGFDEEGTGMPSFVPKLIEARTDALAQLDDSMTVEEKLLALNDWLANWCTFDMARIEADDSANEGKTEDQIAMENFAYMIETTLFGALVGSDYVFGGAGVPKTMCIGYTAAYTFLVQAAFPEIYLKDGNPDNWMDPANWKTKDELNSTSILTGYEQIPQFTTEPVMVEKTEEVVKYTDVPVYETYTDPTTGEVQKVQATDEAGNLLYEEDGVTPIYVQAKDENDQPLWEPERDAEGNVVTETKVVLDEQGNPVMVEKKDEAGNVVTEQVPVLDEQGNQVYVNGEAIYTDNVPTYIIDFVQIKWNSNVTMLGEEKLFDETHFFNAVRLDKNADTWYYIDPCYNDIYVECMGRNRVETDGNMTHSYFLISHDSLAEQFDGNYREMDTLYADKAKDTTYEESWFTSATGPIVKDANYYYYVKNSSIEDADASNPNFNISNLFDGKDQLIARSRVGGKETILLDYTEGTGTTTGGTAVSGAEAVMAADAEELDTKYASVVHSVAIKGSTLYFNAGNIIFTYDLSSGAIKAFKEYNTVSANFDETNTFPGMAYKIVDNGSADAEVVVENHPIAAIAIKTDGKLYASLATNYSKASTYTYEETNYNAEYVNYESFNQGGDNDNDEFLWSANFVETIDLGCSHTYEKVEVKASCTEGAYTEERCATCGAIKEGTKTAVEGSEPIAHHYVRHDEVYYTKSGDNFITGTAYVCVHCLDAYDALPEGATLDHKMVATEEDFVWSENAEECNVTVKCEICSDKKLDVILSETKDTTNTKTVACAIEKEYDAAYTCTEGGKVYHTAVWSTDGCTGKSAVKEVQAPAGTHKFAEAEFVWADDFTCTATVKCQVETCLNSTEAIEAEVVVTPETTNPNCVETGKTVYNATATVGDVVVGTDSKEEVLPALGHTWGEWETAEKSTCTKEGRERRVCTVCNNSESQALPLADHTYGDPTIDVKPTCTEKGSQSVYCTECKELKEGSTTEVAALGHDFKNYVSNEDAKCEVDGTKTAKCERCDVTDTKTDEGSALVHDMAPATCEKASACKREGCTYTEGEALGHSFTNYVSNEDAKCEVDGTETAKCDRCDVTDTKTDEGSALVHDMAEATCTEPSTCKREGCGHTEGEALGHVGSADNCDRCGVEKPAVEIKFAETAGEATYTGEGIEVPASAVEYDSNATGALVFTYYVDEECTKLSDAGHETEGLAPVEPGKYYVKATVKADDNYKTSTADGVYVLTVKPSQLNELTAINQASTIKLSWDKVDEADGYIVYKKKAGSAAAYKVLKTITNRNTVSLTDGNISQGTGYVYTIAAYKDAKDGTRVIGDILTTPTEIVRVKIKSMTNQNGSVKITWTKVEGAAGYKVYRKAEGSDSYARLTTIKKASTTSYTDKTDKTLRNGKKSVYKVVPYYSSSSNVVLTSNTPSHYYITRQSIKSVTAAKKAFTVKWTKNSSAKGYEVWYSTSSSFSSSTTKKKTYTSNSTVSKKYTSLKAGKKYYVKVRSYKLLNGDKVYSAWSATKTVTTKK